MLWQFSGRAPACLTKLFLRHSIYFFKVSAAKVYVLEYSIFKYCVSKLHIFKHGIGKVSASEITMIQFRACKI